MDRIELTRWAEGVGIRLPKEVMDQIVRWGDSIVICKAEDRGKGPASYVADRSR